MLSRTRFPVPRTLSAREISKGMPVNKRKRETRGVRAMMMVAKLSLFFGRFAKMFDSRDRFVVYVVVIFLMKNCCMSSRGKSILTKKKEGI